MASIFTKIINREIPAAIIWEDKDHLAFLSNRPIVPGHTLVIPKKEIDYVFDLKKGDYVKLMNAVYYLAPFIERVMKPVRMGVSIVGLEVPHVHIHLIPLNSIADTDFGRAREASLNELEKIADRVRETIKNG